MAATLLTKLSIAAIVLAVLIMIDARRIIRFKAYIALFFIIYFADNLLIIIANQNRSLQLIPNQIWEGFLVCIWSGKLYSIIFVLAVLYIFRRRLAWEEVGLSLRQESGSLLPAAVVILGVAGWSALVGLASPKGHFDPGVLAYLAIMPGLNEELVYRGGLLAILNTIMPKKINALGARIGWGVVVTSLLFSLLHGFWFDDHLSLHLDMIALRNSLISGFIFAWLKERTHSLVMPVIAHGVEDFLFFLPRMV